MTYSFISPPNAARFVLSNATVPAVTLEPIDVPVTEGLATVDIVISLKDAVDKVELARIYRVPGSKTNCLLWPTGRANNLRNAWVPKKN